MKRWQWGIALLCCAVVWGTTQLPETKTTKVIKRIVYSQDDLTFMRNTLRNITVFEGKKVEVADYPERREMLAYTSIQPSGKGYLMTYDEAVNLFALQNGIVVFTGHTKETGQTVSIFYDDNTTVTYGFIDSFSLLPYTAIGVNEIVATKQAGDLYIRIEKDNQVLDLEQTLTWLNEQM
ncbi:hypothetical protein [Metasolibacillus sp.]|uniref:hypothetical protein n=1 Tax=Metasolibacillus sp. TaxID=2703680 RepID=UPI0025DFF5CA|nr:hypothetical protein [Metasolibacillus sp.]MCT6923109.1 hypothetical protein [Metasolibacillus sp.]MCT6939347.1 hypothetical protein [Metasolibacillus sp.]